MTIDPNTLETIRKNVSQFFNSLLEEGYLNDDVTGFDEKTRKKINNSHERHKLELSLFKKIIDANKKYQILTDDELNVFGFKYVLTTINENMEHVKTFLKVMINPAKIPFNDRTTYGALLGFCFDKLHYDKIRPIMQDIFKIELRNSYTHLDYEINGDTFSFTESSGALVKVNIEEFKFLHREFIETLETLVDFLKKNYINFK